MRRGRWGKNKNVTREEKGKGGGRGGKEKGDKVVERKGDRGKREKSD